MKKVIGIDVSAKKLNIHIMGTQASNLEIPNSIKAIKDFIKVQGLKPDNCIIGAESTGGYHLICQRIFVRKGFEFRLLNPILTNKKIRLSIRKKKTDKSDSRIIASLIAEGEGRIVTLKQLDTTKRTLLRTRRTVVDHRTAIKILIKELKRTEEKEKIQKTVTVLETLITDMDNCVRELEESALKKTEITEVEKLIRSIPGFATQLSAVVASEVGDFTRFPSATKFKAYVGVDPKVTQSGGVLKTGRITKRGNVHLRSAFYLAAQVARQHDPELKEFYEKKKSEGKATRVAIVAVARKLCERVFAVVRRGTPYEIQRLAFA